MTVVVRIVRRHDGRGPCGQLRGVVAPAAAPATAPVLKRLASGSVPSGAGITTCSREPLHPRPGRPQAGLQRAHHTGYAPRRTAMTPVMPPHWQLRRRHVLAAEIPIYQARFGDRFR